MSLTNIIDFYLNIDFYYFNTNQPQIEFNKYTLITFNGCTGGFIM